MFRLKRLNVERVTEDENVRDKLLKEGYDLIEDATADIDLNSLTVDQLKEIAQKKGIEGISKMKKDELLQAIRGAE